MVLSSTILISIHALREEGDLCPLGIGTISPIISIHALREEGDSELTATMPSCENFYPRPPRGGRPAESGTYLKSMLFLSTPSARRATATTAEELDAGGEISIHALREEGDSRPGTDGSSRQNFYPRPPRGGRLLVPRNLTDYQVFLSTPSARRATAKTETKSLFSNKLYNILHEFRRALIYNGSKNYPNHAK